MPPNTDRQKPPPEDIIRKESGPEFKKIKPGETGVDIDDAMIEEPKDDAFERKDLKNQPGRKP